MRKILFVGNSYTFFNDMPTHIFEPMLRVFGNWKVTSVTCGGYRLEQFADPSDPEGQRLRRIAKEHFDFAVLQDHSLITLLEPQSFENGVKEVVNLLQNNVDNFILFATWGRKNGCETLIDLGMTCEQMTEAVATEYQRVGSKFGIPIAHVGRAFVEYAQRNPNAELYFQDMHHPSKLGSTLAAQTILNKILEQIGANDKK